MTSVTKDLTQKVSMILRHGRLWMSCTRTCREMRYYTGTDASVAVSSQRSLTTLKYVCQFCGVNESLTMFGGVQVSRRLATVCCVLTRTPMEMRTRFAWFKKKKESVRQSLRLSIFAWSIFLSCKLNVWVGDFFTTKGYSDNHLSAVLYLCLEVPVYARQSLVSL